MDSLTLLYDCKTKVLQRFFIAKNNKLDKKKKIAMIAIMWVIFLLMAYTEPSENTQNTQNSNQNQAETLIEDNRI